MYEFHFINPKGDLSFLIPNSGGFLWKQLFEKKTMKKIEIENQVFREINQDFIFSQNQKASYLWIWERVLFVMENVGIVCGVV